MKQSTRAQERERAPGSDIGKIKAGESAQHAEPFCGKKAYVCKQKDQTAQPAKGNRMWRELNGRRQGKSGLDSQGPSQSRGAVIEEKYTEDEQLESGGQAE